MLTLNDGRSELWQWDTGRKLTVDGECSQVHFSNKFFGRSIDVDVVDGVAFIPDILLQSDNDLMAWGFVGIAENGYTKISKVFKVNKRNKPADYVFTPPDQTTLKEILDRLEDVENKPDGAITSDSIAKALGYVPGHELVIGNAVVSKDGNLTIYVPNDDEINTGTQICYREPSLTGSVWAEISSKYATIGGKQYLFVTADRAEIDVKDLHEKNDTIIIRIDKKIGNPLFAQVIAAVPKEQEVTVIDGRITPQMFGAKADGTTDDSTAIQAAVDACNAAGGGTVFFPKGTYLIGTAITAYGNQHFIGEHGAVLLLKANSTTGFMTANNVSDLLIEAMTFDAGEGQQAKTDLITVTGSADVTFKNCDFVHGFENLNQGLAFVLVNESSNFQAQNCRFAPDANDGVTAPSTSTACVVAKATDRVIVKDCLFDHADVAMNADAYSTDILVIGNVILDSYIGFNVKDGKQGITCLAINNVMNGKFENLYTFATVVGQGNRFNLCKYSADEPDPTDTAFFDLSSTGALSLKPEYRGAAPDNSYTYAVSDQGVGKEGSLILSLPERIVLPRLIGGKTVMSYQPGMFCGNSRVKEIVVLDLVKAIPAGFCDGAKNLRAVENTDRTTTVGANAFRDTRIGQALFPKLASTGLGARAFQRCMYLEVADLGTTLTKIPDYCFANCLNLKLIKNGTKVTSLGAYAFRGAFSLKALPFMNKLTSLGNYACFNSRIQNWSELKSTAKLGSFATPIADNRTDYWTGSTFTACETPLTTALNQRNPKWVSKKVGNMTFDYTEGCGMLAMMHVHSALSGRQYNTPQEFELELKAVDPSLLSLSPTDPDNYSTVMEALGYTATKITTTIDQDILNELYASLAEGGCAIIGMSGSGTTGTDSDGDGVPDSIQNGNHAVAVYGVNEDGEVMVLDSDTGAHLFEAYEDRRLLTYQVPFQNITGTNTKITIVEKKS